MSDLERQLESLAAAGINLIPAAEVASHFILERDGFLILVERTEEGFGNIGSPGLLTEHGFAALVWRDSQPFFIAKRFEQAATQQQVEAAREFAQAVETCLHRYNSM